MGILCRAGWALILGIPLLYRLPPEKPKAIRLSEVLSIGSLEDDLIFFITSVATDEQGFVYLTDSQECSLKKFDAAGHLVQKTGRKGQGPGDFQFPVIVRYSEGRVYVVDQRLLGIQIFDTELKYLDHLQLEFPIFDFRVLPQGRIFVSSPALVNVPPIVQIAPKEIKDPVSLKTRLDEDFWQSNGKFEFDREGNIVFVTSFEDKVIKFSPERSLLWEKSLMGGKRSGVLRARTSSGSIRVPTEMVYKDVAVDQNGFIFVLAGHLAEHRSRDVYVLDSEGNNITAFTLPEPTHFIHIDKHNYLFSKAAEGVTLIKYRMDYVFK